MQQLTTIHFNLANDFKGQRAAGAVFNLQCNPLQNKRAIDHKSTSRGKFKQLKLVHGSFAPSQISCTRMNRKIIFPEHPGDVLLSLPSPKAIQGCNWFWGFGSSDRNSSNAFDLNPVQVILRRKKPRNTKVLRDDELCIEKGLFHLSWLLTIRLDLTIRLGHWLGLTKSLLDLFVYKMATVCFDAKAAADNEIDQCLPYLGYWCLSYFDNLTFFWDIR